MITDLLQGCVISGLWNEQQSEAESNLRLEQSYCCWRRLLRAPWAARRSNESALKEINPEYSLEGRMLKLKLQYFGHLVQRADIGKSSDAGKERRQEEKRMIEDEMVGWHHRLYGQEFEEAPGGGEGEAWRAAVRGVAERWTQLSDWTTTTVAGELAEQEKPTEWGKYSLCQWVHFQ